MALCVFEPFRRPVNRVGDSTLVDECCTCWWISVRKTRPFSLNNRMHLKHWTQTYIDDLEIQSWYERSILAWFWPFGLFVQRPNNWETIVIFFERNQSISKQKWNLKTVVECMHHIGRIDDQLIIWNWYSTISSKHLWRKRKLHNLNSSSYLMLA